MIVLHGSKLSGHAHRVELMLKMLGLDYQFRPAPADVRASPEFQVLNPLGQIPVLEDGSLVLADSNAILVYLARQYDPAGPWLPPGAANEAAVQRWLSIAAGEVFAGPATARMVALFAMDGDVPRAHKAAARLLRFMEQHLADRQFLAAPHATIADLAVYSYVAHAPEGGIALTPYPLVQAWLRRVEALPGFFPMPTSNSPK